MNENSAEILIDGFDNRLSLNSLSKSSPSNIQLHHRMQQEQQAPPVPPLPSSMDKNKPSNLSHVPCKFFKQGTCTAGANCIFSHNPDPTSESSVCKYFIKGNCKFGTKCALLHTMSPFTNKSSNSLSRSFIDQPKIDPFATSAPTPFSMFLLDNPNTSRFSPQTNRSFLFHSNSSVTSSTVNNNNGINIISNSMHSIQQEKYFRNHQAVDVDDFMLPSSLNDLLTPNELRVQQQQQQQQQIPPRNNEFFGSSSSGSNNRQFSSSPWNVPFYSSATNTTISSSSYSYDESPPITMRSNRGAINIPGTTTTARYDGVEEEEGPFIMDDTLTCNIDLDKELKSTTTTMNTIIKNEKYSSYNDILKRF